LLYYHHHQAVQTKAKRAITFTATGLEPWKARPPRRRRPGLQANPALGHTRNEEAAFPFVLGRLLALLCLLLVLLGLLLRAAVVVTAARQQEAEEQP